MTELKRFITNLFLNFWISNHGLELTRTQGLEAGGDVELQADADPAEEGEGPGGQQGGHPARAAGQGTQGHGSLQQGDYCVELFRIVHLDLK